MRFSTTLLLLLAYISPSAVLAKRKLVLSGEEILEYEGLNGDLRKEMNAMFFSQDVEKAFNRAAKGGLQMQDIEEAVDVLKSLEASHIELDARLTGLLKDYKETRVHLDRVAAIDELVRLRRARIAVVRSKLIVKSNTRGWVKYIRNERELDKLEAQNAIDRETWGDVAQQQECGIATETDVFQGQDRRIMVQRFTVKQAGGRVAKKWTVKNIALLENIAELRVPLTTTGKFVMTFVSVVGGGILGAVIYELLDWKTNWFHDKAVNNVQQRIDIAKKAQAPDDIIREKCMDMHAAATQLEGNAQESSSAIGWESYLNMMKPIYHAAYAQTNAAGVKEINSREIVNWGAPAAPLTAAPIPVDASALQRQNIEEANAQAEEHWSFNEFLRPIWLQFKLAEEHRQNIHARSLVIIRNSTAFSFTTDSDRFNKVYAAFFTRMDVPRRCFKYVKEPNSIMQFYKEGREQQAKQDLETQVAFDYYFGARSALPESAAPLPIVASAPIL